MKNKWLTKEQAAAILGVSERTVMRMADSKQIQQGSRARVGGSPLAVYHPGDVERIRSKRAEVNVNVESFVLPADSDAAKGREVAVAPPLRYDAAMTPAAFAETLGIAISERKPSAGEKVRVTMAEAVQLGFTRDGLRGLMTAGKLENVGTAHRFRFRRRDLDAL